MLGLLIMKNELNDDSNVMMMIEKMRKISASYVNFPNTFLNYFLNVSCSSTNYLWFVLEYISKIDWDCCLFCDEPKSEELRGIVKASSKEKADKENKKIEETYQKIASLIHQLAKQDLFLVEKFSCDDNEQEILEIFKANNAVHHHNCVSNNKQKLKRSLEKRKRDDDKKKETKANKWSKRSDIEETPMIVLGEYKYLFCGVADDVSNFCAGGTQHGTSKNINEESPGQSRSQYSFSWVYHDPRNELPSCVSYWVSKQILSIGYFGNQRATVWFIKNRTPFSQDSTACTRSMKTWNQCISCHWTRKDLHWTSA